MPQCEKIRQGVIRMSDIQHLVSRQHPSLFYSSIFQPITKKKVRDKGCRVYKKDGWIITVSMYDQLDVGDQDLLLAIFALAKNEVDTKQDESYFLERGQNEKNTLVTSIKSSLKGRPSERAELDLKELPFLQINTTAYELLKNMGLNPEAGTNINRVYESLDRLSKTTFSFKGARRGSCSLISYMSDEVQIGDTDQYMRTNLSICINPLSAHSIWAGNGDYIATNRRERHKLKGDIARLLHDRIGGPVREGEGRILTIETLLDYVYPDNASVSDDALRKRRSRVIKAMEEIDNLSTWKCTSSGRGKKLKYNIKRLTAPK